MEGNHSEFEWVVCVNGNPIEERFQTWDAAMQRRRELEALGMRDVTVQSADLLSAPLENVLWAADGADKPKSKRFVLGLAALLAVLGLGMIALAVVTAGPSEAEKAAAAEKAEKKAAEAKEQAEIATCQDEIGDYIGVLSAIDARLDVGMDVDEYTNLVGEAAVEQGKISASDLSDLCVEAIDEADLALSAYSTIASEWDDCIWDDYCDPEWGIDYDGWNRAHDYISDAEAMMNGDEVANGPGSGV